MDRQRVWTASHAARREECTQVVPRFGLDDERVVTAFAGLLLQAHGAQVAESPVVVGGDLLTPKGPALEVAELHEQDGGLIVSRREFPAHARSRRGRHGRGRGASSRARRASRRRSCLPPSPHALRFFNG
jgi:hypothetical protein